MISFFFIFSETLTFRALTAVEILVYTSSGFNLRDLILWSSLRIGFSLSFLTLGIGSSNYCKSVVSYLRWFPSFVVM